MIYTTESEVLATVPHGLEHTSQFVLNRIADGVPVHPDGRPCNATDRGGNLRMPSTLAPHVVESRGNLSLGFVITASDPYFLIDLDGVIRDGHLLPIAHEILNAFTGASVEISNSGTGIHIIGSGSHSVPSNHGCRVSPHLECYTHGRKIALTGLNKSGSALQDCSTILPAFLTHYGFKTRTDADLAVWHETAGPADDWVGPQDDEMLLQSALSAPGGFTQIYGEKCHFRDLWTLNATALSTHYPVAEGKPRRDARPYDMSMVEMAICGHLAFWTGRDSPRIERIISRWQGIRTKWQHRVDYRRDTIAKACANSRDVYDRSFHKQQNIQLGTPEASPNAPLILTVDEMVRNLVYVGSTKEVIHRDLGRTRSWDAAIGEYAASVYEVENSETLKITQHPCLLTWRKHVARSTFDVMTWAPGRPQSCEPPAEKNGNSRAFNTWRGLYVHAAPDDWRVRVQAFITHLEFLVPVAHERERFTQWLAHILQVPGTPPHTAYVMIATTHGIGRNWLSSVLARVIRGHVACSVDLESVLESDFNGELAQKLLAIVDEAHEGLSMSNRYKHGKKLRSLINEECRLINPKYGSQYYEYNACRWLMFSNYEDALPLEREDRRLEYIENPSVRQSATYYSHIYSLTHDVSFIASVYEYLKTYNIASFNAGEHATWNSIKNRALESTTSEVDRIIHELKSEWPGYWILNSYVMRYVEDRISGGKLDAQQIRVVMRRAGFRSSGVSIKSAGRSQRVSIVRDVSSDQIANVSPKLLDQWHAAWVNWMDSDRSISAPLPT